jgi:hypothetical protein
MYHPAHPWGPCQVAERWSNDGRETVRLVGRATVPPRGLQDVLLGTAWLRVPPIERVLAAVYEAANGEQRHCYHLPSDCDRPNLHCKPFASKATPTCYVTDSLWARWKAPRKYVAFRPLAQNASSARVR